MSFTPLHIHTEYSILKSSIKMKELCDCVVQQGYTSVGIADFGNLFGAVEFTVRAKKAGLHPVLGLEAYLVDDKTSKTQRGASSIVLFAQSQKGYENLCQLSSQGYSQGFYYIPRIDWASLEKFSEDVICLTGGENGLLRRHYLNLSIEKAKESLIKLKSIFGDRLFVELLSGSKERDELNPQFQSLALDLNLETVLGLEAYYLKSGDQVLQELLGCIKDNKLLSDENRFQLSSDRFFIPSKEQVLKDFSDYPEALKNTDKIAQLCQFEFKFEDKEGNPIYHLPSYNNLDAKGLDKEIRQLSQSGLKDRFQELEKRGVSVQDTSVYEERLEQELDIISRMGFSGYFLIVQDFICWAKERDIPVGPGRGSGAGSLVAYALKITDLDPVDYDLLFERFLNPERISMPDFDIDFCQARRSEVLEYVKEKYGHENVSQIITYGLLQAKASIRDVGRVLGMSYSEVDTVAKMVPNKLNITLPEALEEEPRFKDAMEDGRVANLIDLACRVEGTLRNPGVHAAGVIISDGPLVQYAPLYKSEDGEQVVQYDMKNSEKIGLIKFDFLGLKTLTMIQKAIELVEQNHDKQIRLNELSLDDKAVYDFLAQGKTDGIFQFSGDGVTSVLKVMKPTSLRELLLLTALYRPGPMEQIPAFLDKRSGKEKVTYLFPELEPILKETSGIIIYQEQAMRIAVDIAGYSMGQADILRRAMGKKQESVMLEQREIFLQGAEQRGFDRKKAGILFDQLAEFAKYGFNKSHAAAYGLISFYTAYLKCYYPVEFYSAFLTSEMSDTDKLMKYVRCARQNGIKIRPPHINSSTYEFSIKDGTIQYALGALKGVGEAFINEIVELRDKHGPFKSLEEFFSRVSSCNKKNIECLIKSGALDGFALNREDLFENYSSYLSASQTFRREKEIGQTNLFDMLGDSTTSSSDCFSEIAIYSSGVRWSRQERLEYEKDILGFYLDSHPMDSLQGCFDFVSHKSLSQVKEIQVPEGSKNYPIVRIVGMGSVQREILTRKNTLMCYLLMEDGTDSLEVVVFPDVYKQSQEVLAQPGMLFLEAEVRSEGEDIKLFAKQISPLFSSQPIKRCLLHIKENLESDVFMNLHQAIEGHPGQADMAIKLSLPDMKEEVMYSLREMSINPTQSFFDAVYASFEGDRDNYHLTCFL